MVPARYLERPVPSYIYQSLGVPFQPLLHSTRDFSCYCASICIQLDFYFSHSFSVLVVAVVPALAYRNVYLIWRIFVRYYITVFRHFRLRLLYNRPTFIGFNYGITDLLSPSYIDQILGSFQPLPSFGSGLFLLALPSAYAQRTSTSPTRFSVRWLMSSQLLLTGMFTLSGVYLFVIT